MTEQDKFTKGVIEEHRKLHQEYLKKEERRVIPDEYFKLNRENDTTKTKR